MVRETGVGSDAWGIRPSMSNFNSPSRVQSRLDAKNAKALELQKYNKIRSDYASQFDIGGYDSYKDQTAYDMSGYEAGENEAVRGVESEFSGASQRENRELGRYGISPTSGRAQSGRERRALNLALARSGARLESRKATDELNFQRETAGREQALTLRAQDITNRNNSMTSEAFQIGSEISSFGLPSVTTSR